MENLALILEIRFKNRTKVVKVTDKRLDFIKKISGEDVNPPEQPDLVQNMEYKHELTKTIVILQENRMALTVEEPNLNEAKNRLSEVLKEIYNTFDFKDNEILRIGIRGIGYSEWNKSFTSLMNKYREIYFTHNSLIDEAIDVGVCLTLKDGDFKVNFNSGPMKPDQGTSLITFKGRNLPHDFAFFDIDRFDNSSNVENNIRSLVAFLNSTIDYINAKSEEVLTSLKS